FPLELAAEQAAHPSPGEAEGGHRIPAEDKAVAERAADGSGLDLAALGRRARATSLVPVSIKRLGRRMLHGTPLCLFGPLPVPVRDRTAARRGDCTRRRRGRAAQACAVSAGGVTIR